MHDTTGTIISPWGRITVTVGPMGVRRVAVDGPEAPALMGVWAEAFAAYLRGVPFAPELPVDLTALPPFTRRVLAVCRRIPFGTTTTYRALADAVGCPRGARAVGQALGRNPALIVIPCHRVLSADGSLTGYAGGPAWKRALLRHEGIDM
jgi:methylated-DNA-[protein]-cysteine S-methyltransferase